MTIRACAVIAAFDEESCIATVVRETARFVCEVIVVDDGSSDATGERARDAGATVLTHARNLGKGCAMRTAIAYALTRPCTHVLFIDGDLQHDPAEIPKLLERAESGAGD